MCLDDKKFIATADGKQIRLFPENYGILSRETTSWWELNIDAAVPEALAVEIFRKVHTNHELRWGCKEIALAALNALITEEKPDEKFDTDWELEEVLENYHIWVRSYEGKEIYQCTVTNCPPQTRAGYYDRDALLKLKGIGQVQAPGFEQAG